MGRVYSTVSWKRYLDSKNPLISEYLSLYGDDFILHTFETIKSAHIQKKSKVILVRFKHSKIVATISKEDYALALDYLLKLCIKLEKYEFCSEIKSFIDNMKIKSIKKKKVLAKPF